MTAEPRPGPPSVTWKQVGPGKFVRVEGGAQSVGPTQPEETVVAAVSAADEGPSVLPLPAPDVAARQDSPDPPATIVDDRGFEAAPGAFESELVTEAYGIAPSAFSPIPSNTASVEAPARNLIEDSAGAAAVPDPAADLGYNKPRHRAEAERF